MLKVHISGWELEEDRWVVRLGDEVSFWMFFMEADPSSASHEELQEIYGEARPVAWEHAEAGRSPVRLDVGPAMLCWEAPRPVSGEVRLVGTICRDATDAPPGFPETRGIVRRIRMEYTPYKKSGTGERLPNADDQKQYVDVAKSFFPAGPDSASSMSSLEVARALVRRAAAALRPARYSEVVLLNESEDDDAAPGTASIEWTGLLLDVEVLGSATT
jgi:hypothetical protein